MVEELNPWWHPEDNLLDGLTYTDLITAICCNIKSIDDETMLCEFHRLLNERVWKSWEMYKEHLFRIKKEVTKRREDYNG